jgi:hypothetical protein
MYQQGEKDGHVSLNMYSLYSLFWMCRETRIEGSMTAINGCVFSLQFILDVQGNKDRREHDGD